jgi:hypothetical protein
MAIFVICDVANPDALEAALREKAPNEHLRLSNNTWLVSSNRPTKALTDDLGITAGEEEGPAGAAILFRTTNYSGFADLEIWEWIEAKLGKVKSNG